MFIVTPIAANCFWMNSSCASSVGDAVMVNEKPCG